MKTIAGSEVSMHPSMREGLFTETPLTPRGKKAVAIVMAAAVAGGIYSGTREGAPQPDKPTAAEISTNISALQGINQLNGAELTLPAGVKLFAAPDAASSVRLTTDQGKLKGKTLVIKYAGITSGTGEQQGIWETAEITDDKYIDASDPIDTVKGQAERLVYFPIDSLDNLPHDVVDAYYDQDPQGVNGGFMTQSGTNADGTVRSGGQGIAAMQTTITPIQ